MKILATFGQLQILAPSALIDQTTRAHRESLVVLARLTWAEDQNCVDHGNGDQWNAAHIAAEEYLASWGITHNYNAKAKAA